MKAQGIWALLALTLGLADVAGAPAGDEKVESYKVDPVHSTIWFRIKHLNVSYFNGRFNEVSGRFTLSDADPAKNAAEVSIKVASVDTNSANREKHLLSEEFFDAEKHPEIRFVSKKITVARGNRYRAEGELTLHGVTKEIAVELERVGSGKDPWGGYRTGFEAVFTIKRSDYGMKMLLGPLGDEVRITLGLEAVRQ